MPNLCLKAREQIDEERMTRLCGHFEDALLAHQRLDLVTADDVALFEHLQRVVVG